MQTVNVPLDERSYTISIGPDLLDDPSLVKDIVGTHRVLVVTDTNVAPLYLDRLMAHLGDNGVSMTLQAGESHKTLASASAIWDRLMALRFARDDMIIALGGGVVGDIGAFAAACYQRGIACAQIPTTVVSQVDSAVGGKTGVNHPKGKNMIGAFHQPRAVIADTHSLGTLDEAEFRAGLAEVIKYGIILDADFFTWLEDNLDALLAHDSDALVHAIARSCEIKAEVVAADERESGQRALLNLGHTFGHAIETGLGHGVWRHGEAVAAGMVMAAEFSVALGWIEPHDRKRIETLLARAQLPTWAPATLSGERMLDLMASDKKVKNGRLRLILPRAIGAACVTDDFDTQALKTLLASNGA